MCGIIGGVNKAISNIQLATIRHRGPDDEDIYSYSDEHYTIQLGHVRLSIQDLTEAGHQPMHSHCGKFVIIFNGEIYNHYELREKLSGIIFKGHSDTETIVNYISKYGINAINDFNGVFAFAIFDIDNSKLFLARDRYGVKPLYFSKRMDSIVFSSEIRPIKQLFDCKIDKKNLSTLLKLRYNASPTTLYDNVLKLHPGHIVEYDLLDHKLSKKSYINPVEIKKNTSFEKVLKKYGELFEQSVKKQLLSDVEVGVLLSGGVDSALVAYYAQKHSKKRIKTFTVGFNERDASDEIIDARESARILGTEHYEVTINDAHFQEVFKDCINIIEEPLGTTSIIPMYYLNQLVAEHNIKVVLTGQGADEPLGGYTRYKGEKIHSQIPTFIFKMISPFLKGIKKESLNRAGYALSEKDTVSRWEKIYTLFNDEEIKRLIGVEDMLSRGFIKYYYNLLKGYNKDSTNAMMSNDMRMNLSDDLLLYTDKISMHFSIEARVPLLDNDLIDFIESLPLEYKIRGAKGKYIHKKFAESVLPNEIIYRQKKGFKSPTEKWFKGDKGIVFKNLLIADNSDFAKVFDVNEVAKVFDMHLKGNRNLEKELFTLISIYYWIEINGI